MKKIFLAAITSLALCSYSYAQDDEDEYEEEETTEAVKPAPAVEDEEEDEAPAPAKKEKKKDKKKKKKSGEDDGAFLGITIGIDQNNLIDFEPNFFIGDFSYVGVMFKINPDMMVTAKIGFAHHGESSYEADKVSLKLKDNFTALALGAQFDYFLPTPLLPTSVSASFMYANGGQRGGLSDEDIDAIMRNPEADIPDPVKETFSAILFDVMFNVHANLTDNLVLTGSVGLGIEMPSVEYEYTGAEMNMTTGVLEEKTVTEEISRTDLGLKAGISLGWFFM